MRHASKRAIRASIHAPAREATMATITPARPAIWFQSTPPHGRRRALLRRGQTAQGVSIHASAREATPEKGDGEHPAQEGFNPRLRTGGDKTEGDVGTPWSVSIHASAREATWAGLRDWLRAGGFNPRLRTGGDAGIRNSLRGDNVFQSTPPHGRRLVLLLTARPALSKFQSTPPHGRRR